MVDAATRWGEDIPFSCWVERSRPRYWGAMVVVARVVGIVRMIVSLLDEGYR